MAGLYSSLDPAKRQIRLSRMSYSPSGEKDSIGCELAVFSLDDAPEYTALSYCWGLQDATCEMVVNAESYSVRPNLYSYLLLMVHERQETWVYIDAICINQQDLGEKSTQVRLMGDVYRGATEVTVWLGVQSDTLRPTIGVALWQRFFHSTHQTAPNAQAQHPKGLLCFPTFWTGTERSASFGC